MKEIRGYYIIFLSEMYAWVPIKCFFLPCRVSRQETESINSQHQSNTHVGVWTTSPYDFLLIQLKGIAKIFLLPIESFED